MANELGFDINSAGLVQATGAVKDLDSATKNLGATAKDTNTVLSQTNDALGKIGNNNAASPFKPMADGLAAVNKGVAETAKIAPTMGQAINSAISKSAGGFQELAAGITLANGGLKEHVSSINEAATAHAGFTTQQMSAAHAARGFAEQVLYSGNVMQAATAQLNHLTYAASGEGGLAGAFGQVASKITGLPPAIALAAAGAAAAALVFVGLGVSISKTGDDIEKAKTDFAAMTGSAASGSEVFEKVRQTAAASSGDWHALGAALQKASEGQNLFASTSTQVVDGLGKITEHSVIYADTAERVQRNTSMLADAMGTLGREVHNAGGSASDQAAVWSALGSSIGKTGSLTADAFQKIRDASLPTAQKISEAFQYKDINAFQAALAKTPATVQQVVTAISAIKPSVDAAFGDGSAKNWGQGVDEVSKQWEHLKETVAETGVFSNIKTLFDAISGTIKGTETDIKNIISIIQGAAAAVESLISKINQAAQSALSIPAFQAQNNSPMQNGNPAGDSNPYSNWQFGQGTSETDNTAQGVADGTLPAFASGGSFTVGGQGGTDSQMIQFMATPGEVVTITPPGGDASSGSGGTASITPLTPTTGGSGGPDIQTLLQQQTDQIVQAIQSLKSAGPSTTTSSSGGAVAGANAGGVGAAAQAAAGLGSPSASGGGKGGGGGGGGKMTDGYDEFDPKQAAARAAQRHKEDEAAGNQADAQSARMTAAQQWAAATGNSLGQAVPIKGFQGASQTQGVPLGPNANALNPPSSVPVNPNNVPGLSNTGMPGSAFSGPVAPDKTTNAVKEAKDKAAQDAQKLTQVGEKGADAGADGVSATKDQTSADANNAQMQEGAVRDASMGEISGAATNAGNITGAIDSGASATESAISSLGNIIDSAMSSVASAIEQAISGLSGQRSSQQQQQQQNNPQETPDNSTPNYNNDYPVSDNTGFGGDGVAGGGDYGGFGGGSGGGGVVGGDFGGGGSFAGGGDSSGGFSGGDGLGGGDGSMGFATGGFFKVPGGGGTDKTPVKFRATAGEHVIVLPPGLDPKAVLGGAGPKLSPQPLDLPGSSADMNLSSSGSGGGGGGSRPSSASASAFKNINVNFIIQPGPQADDFMRSRSQIQRAMSSILNGS